MESVVKGYFTLFCIMAMVLLGIGVVMGSMNAAKAEHFLSNASYDIAQGNFQTAIITKWKNEAEKNQYCLEVKEIDVNEDGVIEMADLTLRYRFFIPFISNQGTEHEIKGYAK